MIIQDDALIAGTTAKPMERRKRRPKQCAIARAKRIARWRKANKAARRARKGRRG